MKSIACVLCVAAAASPVTDAFVTNISPPTVPPRTALNAEPFEGTVVVCTGGSCTRNGGGKKAVALFEELAGDSVQIETISCVSDCAECALGPNVELRAKGDGGPFYPIKNKVKSEDDIKAILGIE